MAWQSGISMIEVLVAMVILSFGLLGVAGMQLTGIRSSQSSYLRSQAITVMNDLAERMRSNQPGTKAGSYVGFNSTTVAAAYSSCTTAPAKICGKENGGATPGTCTATEMATYDEFVVTCGLPANGGARPVQTTLAGLLPSGQISVICINNASGGGAQQTAANCKSGFRQVITVSWQERAANAGAASGQSQLVTTTIQP